MQHQYSTIGSLRALGVALILAAASGAAGATQSSGLDPSWYDGQAEVSGYRWHGTRYGEPRTGEAVAIFVTEPFSDSMHVKADRADSDDTVTALKLNLVRDFQTGIYDYNTMTSVFVDVDDGQLMKSTFSSAEWCGHVFESIDVRAGVPTVTTDSYFEGESGVTTLPARSDGLIGDQLFIWLRGLQGAPIEAGASIRVPYMNSSFERRLNHQKAAWGSATIERAAALESVQVPAGSFEAIGYRISSADDSPGPVGVVHIEAAAPHRLLSWSLGSARGVIDAGELTGTKRLKYWSLNHGGEERMRAEIGLTAQ